MLMRSNILVKYTSLDPFNLVWYFRKPSLLVSLTVYMSNLWFRFEILKRCQRSQIRHSGAGWCSSLSEQMSFQLLLEGFQWHTVVMQGWWVACFIVRSGSRPQQVHWGRLGHPKSSQFDFASRRQPPGRIEKTKWLFPFRCRSTWTNLKAKIKPRQAMHDVARCPFVCPSITRRYCVEMAKQ